MATYTYSLSADFGNQICLRTLTHEIDVESLIVTALSHITVSPTASFDDVDIVFTASLSASEITALSAVVSAHDGSVCPEPASFTGFTVPVSGISPVTDDDIALKSYTDAASANALIQANVYTDSVSAAGGVSIYDNGVLVTGSPFSNIDFINTTISTSGDTVSIEIDETVFGQHFQDSESSGESGTTGDTFQDKISITPSGLTSGRYRIGWYCELQETSTSGYVEARMYIDSTERARAVIEPQDVANWYPFGGFAYKDVTGGSMTVQLQWREVGSGTGSIRNARVEIWRVS
jgi:hypothetical protein